MQTILVIGQIGVGKSLFMSLLKERACSIFIADCEIEKLWRFQSPCYTELKELFFEADFYFKDGNFNKKKISHSIFKDLKRKKSLEKILHPRVRQSFQEFVKKEKQKKTPYVFYEAPLISFNLFKEFDKSILIITDKKIQKERLLKRGLSVSEIKECLENQISNREVKRQVDFTVDNRKDIFYLKQQIQQILKKLNKK
ncbi:MAG: dephospho-CoA kinase [Bdellovibrionales bacterium]|nr:dephospho-CoA kinase [Bdellovibrionales bacterium]